MMTERCLWHVTLSTGHTRRSYRHEVSQEAILACNAMLSVALQEAQDGPPPRAAIAPLPGYSMIALGSGRNVVLTILHGDDRILTIGIATHSRGGANLWKLLTETSAIPVHPLAERCPPEPWVAARIEPAIADCPQNVIEMLGDMERCLGWAWIERVLQ